MTAYVIAGLATFVSMTWYGRLNVTEWWQWPIEILLNGFASVIWLVYWLLPLIVA